MFSDISLQVYNKYAFGTTVVKGDGLNYSQNYIILITVISNDPKETRVVLTTFEIEVRNAFKRTSTVVFNYPRQSG